MTNNTAIASITADTTVATTTTATNTITTMMTTAGAIELKGIKLKLSGYVDKVVN